MSNAILNLRSINATTIQNNNTNFTWENINLRLIIGNENFYKYKKFKLIINNIMTSLTDANLGIDVGDRFVLINIGCNSFENHNYNVLTGNNSGNSSILCPFYFVASNCSLEQYNNNSITFNTNKEITSINIFYSHSALPGPPLSVVPYPEMTFMFSIVGIEN